MKKLLLTLGSMASVAAPVAAVVACGDSSSNGPKLAAIQTQTGTQLAAKYAGIKLVTVDADGTQVTGAAPDAATSYEYTAFTMPTSMPSAEQVTAFNKEIDAINIMAYVVVESVGADHNPVYKLMSRDDFKIYFNNMLKKAQNSNPAHSPAHSGGASVAFNSGALVVTGGQPDKAVFTAKLPASGTTLQSITVVMGSGSITFIGASGVAAAGVTPLAAIDTYNASGHDAAAKDALFNAVAKELTPR